MEKKILIGSIISIAVLIGISFTSVVGYNSLESDIKASPLFNIRTRRALSEESKDLTCDYLGKGEATEIQLPERNDRIESVDNLINLIKGMDDKSLKRFAYLIMYYLHNDENTQEFDYEEILQSLKQLRDNPNSKIEYIKKRKDSILTNLCTAFCWTNDVYCKLKLLLMLIPIFIIATILHILLLPIYIILSLLTLATNNCPDS